MTNQATGTATPIWPKEGTQYYKILKALLDAQGDWVNGQYFCRTLWLTQYHAVIFKLENRFNWPIQHSEFTDEFGFVSYRIEPSMQLPLV